VSCNALLQQKCMKQVDQDTILRLCSAAVDSVLQSSTEDWGARFALSSAAVHRCWLTAPLYEEQICIGVTTVLKCKLWACFAEQHWTLGISFCQSQCCSALLLAHCTLFALHTGVQWCNTKALHQWS